MLDLFDATLGVVCKQSSNLIQSKFKFKRENEFNIP